MKVGLFNYSDNSGGAARATYRIHKSLLNENIDSSLYVSKKTLTDKTIKTSPYFIDKILIKTKTKISSTILKLYYQNDTNYRSIAFIPSSWPKFINNSHLDIVHLNWINAEMMSIEDIKKISKPIVWTFHDMWPLLGDLHLNEVSNLPKIESFDFKKKFKSIFDLDKWTYKRKKKNWIKPFNIVTPSKWLENCVKNSEYMNEWPVTTIHHPVNTDFWKPISKIEAKKILGLNPEKKIILYGADGGTKSFNKGFDMLLNAINLINFSNLNVHMCIFGDDNEDLKLPIPYINFGYINDDTKLRLLYCAADVCIIPSRKESFCQVALEAQSCGTPVISFSVGGLNDIIKHEETGFLAPNFDIERLALFIEKYLNNKYEYMEFNKRSRTRVERLFSKSSIAKKYISLYDSIKLV